MSKNKHFEQGNVLFLILIAVALFAALSYVVSNSSRSGGADTGNETGGLVAADFINYSVQMRTAIQRMIASGCTDTQINYSHPFFGVYYDNPNAPSNKKCNVFDKEGGGVPFRKIQVTKDYSAVAELIGNFNVVDIGTTESDLLLVLFLQPGAGNDQVNLNVCKSVFKAQKMNVPPGSSDTVPPGIPFQGTYTSGGTIGDTLPALAGQDVGCVSGGPDQWYTAYYVLVAR